MGARATARAAIARRLGPAARRRCAPQNHAGPDASWGAPPRHGRLPVPANLGCRHASRGPRVGKARLRPLLRPAR
eukprot:4662408-Lingulodinium_polyedra.AAC.1